MAKILIIEDEKEIADLEKDYLEMNDFEVEYVLSNFERKPIKVNKLVMIADWWGEKKKIDWETDFTPEKIKITQTMKDILIIKATLITIIIIHTMIIIQIIQMMKISLIIITMNPRRKNQTDQV